MILGFGNNVVSALAGDITTIQTDIPVMPGTGAKFAKLLSADFENKSNEQRVYAKITLTDNKESAFEVCHLVSVNGDVLKVIRGQEGTTAKGWSLNDVVANFATRGSENHFVQIAQLQSGHYIAGVAGGTANALTLELPATFFVNGGTDWTLRTPIIIFPVQNNTNAATLQLTLGGRVLGTFPLYKGNKSELSANDIIKDVPLMCILDSTKSFFSVLNPLDIYLQYLRKDENGADIPDKATFVKNIGAARAHSGSISIGGDNGNWTTAQFIDWLDAQGAFNHPYWMVKGSWSYASNKIITDTGCGNIQLAGAVVEVMGTRSAMTIRVTTPTTVTDGTADAQFTYINHGDGYSPGWRRDYNTKYKPTHSDVGALAANGNAVSATKLQTPRKINNVAFDGTSDITISVGMSQADGDNRYQQKNTASKAGNGWFKDTSTGVIIQWGYLGNASAGLTFPISFPSACTSITITNAYTRADYSISLKSLSAAGATFNSENNGVMYWTAIGY
ncbi:TPA: hypothetical protein J1W43_004595 [Escherichia coli]|nr:hypothetical protein [Escherichia coli]HBA8270814.1 hypothetical protein [Escherichia coli]HBA8733396.1 hypothetical protein [Escherichia coli]